MISSCVFAIAGTISTTQKVAKLKAEAAGAQLKAAVDSSVTHLIATPQEFAKKSPKIQAAVKLGIPIVSESFFDDLIEGRTCNPTDYPQFQVSLPSRRQRCRRSAFAIA